MRIFPASFGEVFIPAAVAAELADVAAPAAVRRWIAQPAGWIRVCPISSRPDAELEAALDAGEREAIQLAIERKADVLIMDEWKGRSVARSRGIPLNGALGLLGDAYQRGLIDDPLRILAVMRRHGFRVNDRLVERFEVAAGPICAVTSTAKRFIVFR